MVVHSPLNTWGATHVFQKDVIPISHPLCVPQEQPAVSPTGDEYRVYNGYLLEPVQGEGFLGGQVMMQLGGNQFPCVFLM